MKYYTTEQVAEKLHSIRCRASHTDQCSWEHEIDFTGYEHQKWVKIASKLAIHNDFLYLFLGQLEVFEKLIREAS